MPALELGRDPLAVGDADARFITQSVHLPAKDGWPASTVFIRRSKRYAPGRRLYTVLTTVAGIGPSPEPAFPVKGGA